MIRRCVLVLVLPLAVHAQQPAPTPDPANLQVEKVKDKRWDSIRIAESF